MSELPPPQLENGFTIIANEVLEELVSYNLTKNEIKLTLILLRLSWGIKSNKFVLNKISNKNISKLTKLAESRVSESLKSLIDKGIFAKDTLGNIFFNKFYNTWGTPVSSEVLEKITKNVKITENVISELEKITENVILNYEKRKKILTENVICDDGNLDSSKHTSLFKKNIKKIKETSSLDINFDIDISKKDDDDFLKNTLYSWNVVNISELIEKHGREKLLLVIKKTKEHNPKSPGAYFRSLLPISNLSDSKESDLNKDVTEKYVKLIDIALSAGDIHEVERLKQEYKTIIHYTTL